MDGPRSKRPDLHRRNPFRGFANIVDNVGHPRQAYSDPRDEPASEDESGAEHTGNFAESGVRAAYKVFDQYIQQGQKLARDINRSAGRGQHHDGGAGYETDTSRLGDIQARALRGYMDLLGSWFELVGMVGSPGRYDDAPYQGAGPNSGNPSEGGGQASSDSLHVSDVVYEVRSERPVRITSEVSPSAYFRTLATHGLRCLQHPEQQEIALQFSSDQRTETVVLSIDVPADVLPGIYTGLALDSEDGEILGNIRLEVL